MEHICDRRGWLTSLVFIDVTEDANGGLGGCPLSLILTERACSPSLLMVGCGSLAFVRKNQTALLGYSVSKTA